MILFQKPRVAPHNWFAWFPVIVEFGYREDGALRFDYPIVWLQTVQRTRRTYGTRWSYMIGIQ